MATRMEQRENGLLGRFLAWWVTRVASYPWMVIFLCLLVTGSALHYTINHLKVNTDTSNLLSAELPFRKAYLQYEAAFPEQINTFLVVIDGETSLLARNAALLLATQIASDQELIEDVYTPKLGEFFDRNGLLYLENDELGQLTDRLSTLQPFLARMTSDQSLNGLLSILGEAMDAARDGEVMDLKPILTELDRAFNAKVNGSDHRISWQEMMQGDSVDADAKRQIIIVKPRLDFSNLQPAEPSIKLTRQLIEKLGITPENGLNARLTGLLALEYEELQSVKKGGLVAALLSLAMAVIALWFAFRSMRLVLVTFLGLIAGLILTACFAALTVGQLNMITVAFGVLYIGLGVDFAIHLILRYRELYGSKMNHLSAMKGCALDIGPSLAVCALTTAVGFYSFIPTDYLGVSELGIISGSGMFISLLVTLTFLPALLSVRPFHLKLQTKKTFPKGAPAFLTFLPQHFPVAVRRVALVTALAAVFFLPGIYFDYDPLSLRDPESESIRTFNDLLANSKTPPRSVTVMVAGESEAKEIVSRLRVLSSAGKVVSIKNFVPEKQDEKLAEIENLQLILGSKLENESFNAGPGYSEQLQSMRRFDLKLNELLESKHLPAWRDQAALVKLSLDQLLVFLSEQPEEQRERIILDLQRGVLEEFPGSIHTLKISLSASPVEINTLPDKMIHRWISDSGIYRIEVYPKQDIGDGETLRRFVNDVRSVAEDATGPPVVALESGKAVVGAFQQAFLGALVVISIILISLLRKLSDATYVMIPLLWAGLLTGATTVLLDIPFNFANIIALPLLLGIGVDNGIHVVHRIRTHRQTYAQLLGSSTSRGIFYSAITTIVSFLSLSFSAHPGTASMGLILTVGVLLTMIGTLIVLPASLAFVPRR